MRIVLGDHLLTFFSVKKIVVRLIFCDQLRRLLCEFNEHARQLVTSLVFDHFAIMNVPHYPISIARIIGGVFLFVGAVLIRW